MKRFYLIIAFFLAFSAAIGQQQQDPVALAEKADLSKSIQLYPNPAVDYLNVKLDALKASEAKITLHNIIGNELKIEVEQVNEHQVRIRVKELAAGYYLLAIQDEAARYRGTFKFLKR